MAVEGLITRRSHYAAAETLQRLERAATEHGYIIYARLDHAAAAATMALKMPASTALIFGNPRTGMDFLLTYPTLAIDLPLRALVWADAIGQARVSYNSAQHLLACAFARHSVPVTQALTAQVQRTSIRLAAIVDTATNPA